MKTPKPKTCVHKFKCVSYIAFGYVGGDPTIGRGWKTEPSVTWVCIKCGGRKTLEIFDLEESEETLKQENATLEKPEHTAYDDCHYREKPTNNS